MSINVQVLTLDKCKIWHRILNIDRIFVNLQEFIHVLHTLMHLKNEEMCMATLKHLKI